MTSSLKRLMTSYTTTTPTSTLHKSNWFRFFKQGVEVSLKMIIQILQRGKASKYFTLKPKKYITVYPLFLLHTTATAAVTPIATTIIHYIKDMKVRHKSKCGHSHWLTTFQLSSHKLI